MARLVGESGSVAGTSWPIEVGITLGREAHNTIGMPDNKKASRDHAKVWKEGPGRYAVADLGSTNGTLVNDEKITRHPLVDGDEIRVGEFTFRFVLDDDEKPKKKEGPARMAAVLSAAQPTFADPAGGLQQPAEAAAPKIEVKQRVLQYSKKAATGSVARWDLAQASQGTRWIFYLVALAIAAGLFFLVKTLIAG
jgi:predicted component of type VI protein secretion system